MQMNVDNCNKEQQSVMELIQQYGNKLNEHVIPVPDILILVFDAFHLYSAVKELERHLNNDQSLLELNDVNTC